MLMVKFQIVSPFMLKKYRLKYKFKKTVTKDISESFGSKLLSLLTYRSALNNIFISQENEYYLLKYFCFFNDYFPLKNEKAISEVYVCAYDSLFFYRKCTKFRNKVKPSPLKHNEYNPEPKVTV